MPRVLLVHNYILHTEKRYWYYRHQPSSHYKSMWLASKKNNTTTEHWGGGGVDGSGGGDTRRKCRIKIRIPKCCYQNHYLTDQSRTNLISLKSTWPGNSFAPFQCLLQLVVFHLKAYIIKATKFCVDFNLLLHMLPTKI